MRFAALQSINSIFAVVDLLRSSGKKKKKGHLEKKKPAPDVALLVLGLLAFPSRSVCGDKRKIRYYFRERQEDMAMFFFMNPSW